VFSEPTNQLADAIDALRRGADELGVKLSSGQLAAFASYVRELLEWNRRFNLTAITDPVQVATHHLVDSLTCLKAIAEDDAISVVDVGSGAGLPGIPLKIVRPRWHMLLLDSLRKRVGFLGHVVGVLGLSNVDCVHLRAEDAGRSPAHRERYQLAVARAVADMRVLAELCLPLVKPGGRFLAMKGPRGLEELGEAERAIWALGGGNARAIELPLPLTDERRVLILVDKLRPCPAAYPRRPGQPSRNPIG